MEGLGYCVGQVCRGGEGGGEDHPGGAEPPIHLANNRRTITSGGLRVFKLTLMYRICRPLPTLPPPPLSVFFGIIKHHPMDGLPEKLLQRIIIKYKL